MFYKLVRSRQDGNAVHGTLCSVEHRFSGSTGKTNEYLTPISTGKTNEYLTPICRTLENADYLIPALTYRVDVTISPRFKRPLPILLQVPGRTGIRFHRGSRPEHSKGCILLTPDDERAITALWRNEKSSHLETRLEITDIPPERN